MFVFVFILGLLFVVMIVVGVLLVLWVVFEVESMVSG